MAVGDVTSDAKGSGARYNDGKAPLQYIPMRNLILWAMHQAPSGNDKHIKEAGALASFEQRELAGQDLLRSADDADLANAARVFEYGSKKYAAWNWAKGMAWSIPMACAKRHWLAAVCGEENDEESGLPHMGHFWCNLIMLQHYARFYTEGDDLPPKSIFQVSGNE